MAIRMMNDDDDGGGGGDDDDFDFATCFARCASTSHNPPREAFMNASAH